MGLDTTQPMARSEGVFEDSDPNCTTFGGPEMLTEVRGGPDTLKGDSIGGPIVIISSYLYKFREKI